MTKNPIAEYRSMYIFYAAYSNTYLYKNLVNVARPTGSRTKAFVSGTATTPEIGTLIKTSNAPEKGDKFF